MAAPVSHAGRVTAIQQHHGSGKHATIEVTHGKRKRMSGPDGEKGSLVSYDQPRSNVVVPKAQAKNFAMGQRVNVGVSPATDPDGDDDQNAPDADADDQMASTPTPAVRNAAPARKGKVSGKKAKASPPKRGQIFNAITRGQ